MPLHGMHLNNTETTDNNTRSVFFCPLYPNFTWDLKSTTTSWILVFILAFASPVTILLNLLIIIAVKRRKELQKPVNILLSSMAVADFLTGVISMPLSATVHIFILRQVSPRYICALETVISKPMLIFICTSSLYHLTAIAWDRYVAIQKSIDYKVIVTKGLLKKLSLVAWLLALFTSVPAFVVAGVGMDHEDLEIKVTVEAAVGLICLIAIAYFYIMVYLGVRKRKINEISQVNALIKAKLESKVAKTTGLLTASLMLSFLPAMGMTFLRNIFSVFAKSSFLGLGETFVLLNSLASPVLYCYKDRKFRKVVLELLGVRKSNAVQLEDGAARFAIRKKSFGSVEQLKKSVGYKNFRELLPIPSSSNENGSRQVCAQPRLTRSVSCDAAIFENFVHPLAKPHESLIRRKLSAPI